MLLLILDCSVFYVSMLVVYVQDEWKIGDDWIVNYGLCGDCYKVFGCIEGQFSFCVGVVWNVSDSIIVYVGYLCYFMLLVSELIVSSDIVLYDGIINQQLGGGNNILLVECSDYYDIGVLQQVGDYLILGLDVYD